MSLLEKVTTETPFPDIEEINAIRFVDTFLLTVPELRRAYTLATEGLANIPLTEFEF